VSESGEIQLDRVNQTCSCQESLCCELPTVEWYTMLLLQTAVQSIFPPTGSQHCTAVCQLQDRHARVTVPVWSHQEISDGWLATCYITDAHDICIVLTLECWFFSHTDTSFNDRTFAASALWMWNSQSADLKEPSPSHGQYKRSFKTLLFGVWSHSAVWPHH